MNEFPGNSNDSFESSRVAGNDSEANRVLDGFQAVFERGYIDFFHNMDPEMRKRLGIRILSSLDYAYPSASRSRTDTINSTRPLATPIKLIVSRYESVIAGDRDLGYPPLVTKEPETQLPALANGKYSPKIGILLNRPLYLVRKLFVLVPDGDVQRGVEQIIASMAKDTQPIGEVWLGKKWLNLPNRPITSNESSNKLMIRA